MDSNIINSHENDMTSNVKILNIIWRIYVDICYMFPITLLHGLFEYIVNKLSLVLSHPGACLIHEKTKDNKKHKYISELCVRTIT